MDGYYFLTVAPIEMIQMLNSSFKIYYPVVLLSWIIEFMNLALIIIYVFMFFFADVFMYFFKRVYMGILARVNRGMIETPPDLPQPRQANLLICDTCGVCFLDAKCVIRWYSFVPCVIYMLVIFLPCSCLIFGLKIFIRQHCHANISTYMTCSFLDILLS